MLGCPDPGFKWTLADPGEASLTTGQVTLVNPGLPGFSLGLPD